MFGSLSLLSSESHATLKGKRQKVKGKRGSLSITSFTFCLLSFACSRSHSASSVVLPKPAGAAISVSGRLIAWLRRASRCGRGTSAVRGRGIYSLVVSSGVDDRAADGGCRALAGSPGLLSG